MDATRIAAWAGGVTLFWGALAWIVNRGAYYPMRFPDGAWEERQLAGADEVWIDGRLNAWWKPRAGAKAAVLFLHGNAGNVSHRGAAMADYAAAGASVLVLDYRGYGKSPGWPSESGLYEDAAAGYDWLRGRGWGEDRIVLVGESLGTSVAVETALRRRPAALILEAPLQSARAMAQRLLPLVGPLVTWGFDSRAKIGKLAAPLLVIHGDEDEVVPQTQGRAVFEAARGRKIWWGVAGKGHNDLHDGDRGEFRARVAAFMMDACNAAVSLPPAPPRP